MSDYEPKFLYANAITGVTSASVTGGQVLTVSGNGTIAPTSGKSAAVIGVANHDAASGSRVAFTPRGKVHISTASGAITAGAQVTSATGGAVASLAVSAAVGNTAGNIDTAANDARSVIGVALTTAADTASVEWMQL